MENKLIWKSPVWYGCKLPKIRDDSFNNRGVVTLPTGWGNEEAAAKKLAKALVACAEESIDAVMNKKN